MCRPVCLLFTPSHSSVDVLDQAMPQLTAAEQARIDDVVRKQRHSPIEAWRVVNTAREKKGLTLVGKSAVHRYCRGRFKK